MRHVYECQMRRADLHGETISNVAFVDYLQEARLDLLRYQQTSPTPQPGEGLVVVRTTIEYLAPLRLSQAPLFVSVWPTEVRAASFTLGYELFTGTPDAPHLHGRATTVLTPYVFSAGRPRRLSPEERERLTPHLDAEPITDRSLSGGPPQWGPATLERPVYVRFSDIDLLGHVNNLQYLEYSQLAQVDLLTGVFIEARINGHVQAVLARTEIEYLGQMELRAEPYAVRSRVVGVGRTSAVFEQEIRDGNRVMARSRMVEVNVDEDEQPLAWHPRHRELFEERLRGGAGSGTDGRDVTPGS